MKGTREIRPNLISIPLKICDSCFWRLFRFLRTSPCVLLKLVCSPIVISCKTLYKTSKGFLGLSGYRWGNYIAVFCLAVSPRENLSQRISVGSRGVEAAGQHLGPIEKKVNEGRWEVLQKGPKRGWVPFSNSTFLWGLLFFLQLELIFPCSRLYVYPFKGTYYLVSCICCCYYFVL